MASCASSTHSTDPLTDLSPEEILDTALQKMQSGGIEPAAPVHECPPRGDGESSRSIYSTPFSIRSERVAFYNIISFLVPDKDFRRASDPLEHMGHPLRTPSKFSLLTEGDTQAKGRSHLIRRSKITAFDYHLVVYPLSFPASRSCELSEQPARYSELQRCSHILVPRPAAVYASLMRA